MRESGAHEVMVVGDTVVSREFGSRLEVASKWIITCLWLAL